MIPLLSLHVEALTFWEVYSDFLLVVKRVQCDGSSSTKFKFSSERFGRLRFLASIQKIEFFLDLNLFCSMLKDKVFETC